MAFLNCDVCGGEVSSKTKTCQHCGEKQKPAFGFYSKSFILIGIAFAVFAFLNAQGRKEMLAESAENACVKARIAVEDRLRAPSTADFSDCNENTSKKQQNGSWAVGGYVDAQNAFGAKVRSVYYVNLTYVATTWQVNAVEIEPK